MDVPTVNIDAELSDSKATDIIISMIEQGISVYVSNDLPYWKIRSSKDEGK